MSAQLDTVALTKAKEFVTGRLGDFIKDTNICLTPNAEDNHAYLPGVFSCVTFLELLSGLRWGRLKHGGSCNTVEAVNAFCAAYMPPIYNRDNIELLYFVFREQIAHIGIPHHAIAFPPKHRLRKLGTITWLASDRRDDDGPALELRSKPIELLRAPKVVRADHRFEVCVSLFQQDLTCAAKAYIDDVAGDEALQRSLIKAMQHYWYPKI